MERNGCYYLYLCFNSMRVYADISRQRRLPISIKKGGISVIWNSRSTNKPREVRVNDSHQKWGQHTCLALLEWWPQRCGTVKLRGCKYGGTTRTIRRLLKTSDRFRTCSDTEISHNFVNSKIIWVKIYFYWILDKEG